MQNGDHVEAAHAALWFDKDVIGSDDQKALAQQIDKGIGDLERFLGVKFDPRRLGVEKIPHFITGSAGISHVSGWADLGVFLAISRVQTNNAPYLHETTHYLLTAHPRNGEPFHSAGEPWLAEGFASYVEDAVVERFGGRASHLFTKGGNAAVDAEALAVLQTENGRAVLPYVGTHGSPPAMVRDRTNVAAPFYLLSQSFCKFLTGHVGVAKMVALSAMDESSGDMEERVAAATGKPADAWIKEWLKAIGYKDPQ